MKVCADLRIRLSLFPPALFTDKSLRLVFCIFTRKFFKDKQFALTCFGWDFLISNYQKSYQRNHHTLYIFTYILVWTCCNILIFSPLIFSFSPLQKVNKKNTYTTYKIVLLRRVNTLAHTTTSLLQNTFEVSYNPNNN